MSEFVDYEPNALIYAPNSLWHMQDEITEYYYKGDKEGSWGKNIGNYRRISIEEEDIEMFPHLRSYKDYFFYMQISANDVAYFIGISKNKDVFR